METSSDFAEASSDVAQSPRELTGKSARDSDGGRHSAVDLQGWLKKAPYGNLSMFGMLMLKKRYFVLSADTLSYYHTDEEFMMDAEPLGTIQLDSFSTLTAVDGIDQWGLQLLIAGKDNAVYLQAGTRETRKLWQQKLRKVIVAKNRTANIVHEGYLSQRVTKNSGLTKTVKPYYFVVLADKILSLSSHYDDDTAVSKGAIFFTPGSTVRKIGPKEFVFTGADGAKMAVIAADENECEKWLSILIRTIEEFSQNLENVGVDESESHSASGGDAIGHPASHGSTQERSDGELAAAPESPTSRLRSAAKRLISRRHSFKVMSNEYRLWVGTWNMGNEDPLKGLSDQDLQEQLSPLVPKGHDIYVLGVQECTSGATFDAVERFLQLDSSGGDGETAQEHDPVLQIPLGVAGVDPLARATDSLTARDILNKKHTVSEESPAPKLKNNKSKGASRRFSTAIKTSSPVRGTKSKSNQASNDPPDNFAGLFRLAKESVENRPDRIYGRGDGAILFPKFTGMALFMKKSVIPNVRVPCVGKCELTSGPLKSSKGATAFVLQLHNYVSMCFINCHLEANKPPLRRAQFKTIVEKLGSTLYPLSKSHREAQDAGLQLELTGLFHHTMWMGDLNYRMVGLSGRQVQHLLKKKKVQEMHSKADGFVRDQAEFDLFHGFYEPDKADDFYPTYKKFESPNPPVDYSQPDWPDKCYRTLYKEPQYKGGKWKERVPGWCDRILLRHMQPHDRSEGGNDHSTVRHTTHYLCRPRLTQDENVDGNDSEDDDKRRTWQSSYTSVNSGTAMVVSDHSPVRCSYNISVHGFNETPAQKITLSLSEIMMVEEAGGSGFKVCPMWVRLVFPAPYEEISNQSSVDVLKTQDSRYTSTDAETGLSLKCSYHHRKPLTMLHAVLRVRAKNGATGQCVFALDDMCSHTLKMEAVYELELHDRGVPLRMGWQSFSDPIQKKKSKNAEESDVSSDEDEALFADCAGDAADNSPGHTEGGTQETVSSSGIAHATNTSSSVASGSANEPPPMKPVVFKPLAPNSTVLTPRILVRFRCKACVDEEEPVQKPAMPPAAAKPQRTLAAPPSRK